MPERNLSERGSSRREFLNDVLNKTVTAAGGVVSWEVLQHSGLTPAELETGILEKITESPEDLAKLVKGMSPETRQKLLQALQNVEK